MKFFSIEEEGGGGNEAVRFGNDVCQPDPVAPPTDARLHFTPVHRSQFVVRTWNKVKCDLTLSGTIGLIVPLLISRPGQSLPLLTLSCPPSHLQTPFTSGSRRPRT